MITIKRAVNRAWNAICDKIFGNLKYLT